jgi:hypothetical protein
MEQYKRRLFGMIPMIQLQETLDQKQNHEIPRQKKEQDVPTEHEAPHCGEGLVDIK